MMPVIAYNLLQSIDVMAHAAAVFARRCVTGIRANVERCRDYGERTASLVTAIAPVVGYDKAAELFKIALAQDKPIRQVLLDEAVLAPERVDEILDLLRLTQGGRA
jgi:fumarate hydratase class II